MCIRDRRVSVFRRTLFYIKELPCTCRTALLIPVKLLAQLTRAALRCFFGLVLFVILPGGIQRTGNADRREASGHNADHHRKRKRRDGGKIVNHADHEHDGDGNKRRKRRVDRTGQRLVCLLYTSRCV